jgi:hypothetical protein
MDWIIRIYQDDGGMKSDFKILVINLCHLVNTIFLIGLQIDNI